MEKGTTRAPTLLPDDDIQDVMSQEVDVPRWLNAIEQSVEMPPNAQEVTVNGTSEDYECPSATMEDVRGALDEVRRSETPEALHDERAIWSRMWRGMYIVMRSLSDLKALHDSRYPPSSLMTSEVENVSFEMITFLKLLVEMDSRPESQLEEILPDCVPTPLFSNINEVRPTPGAVDDPSKKNPFAEVTAPRGIVNPTAVDTQCAPGPSELELSAYTMTSYVTEGLDLRDTKNVQNQEELSWKLPVDMNRLRSINDTTLLDQIDETRDKLFRLVVEARSRMGLQPDYKRKGFIIALDDYQRWSRQYRLACSSNHIREVPLTQRDGGGDNAGLCRAPRSMKK
jgi:hypothetical protein